MFNLIGLQTDTKIYLYAKDPHEAKYKLLINKREGGNQMIWMIVMKIIKKKQSIDCIWWYDRYAY